MYKRYLGESNEYTADQQAVHGLMLDFKNQSFSWKVLAGSQLLAVLIW